MAFNARDVETVLGVMHPDVDWPNGMEGGRVLGRDAVRAYWTRQWGMIDPTVEPRRLLRMADGRVASTSTRWSAISPAPSSSRKWSATSTHSRTA